MNRVAMSCCLVLLLACGPPPPEGPAEPRITVADWATIGPGMLLTCKDRGIGPGQATLSDGRVYCVWECATMSDGSRRFLQVLFEKIDSQWTVAWSALEPAFCPRPLEPRTEGT